MQVAGRGNLPGNAKDTKNTKDTNEYKSRKWFWVLSVQEECDAMETHQPFEFIRPICVHLCYHTVE